MATTLTPQNRLGPYATSGGVLTMVAADATGDNWQCTGNESIVVKNGDTGAHIITVAAQTTGLPDARAAAGDNFVQSIPAGGVWTSPRFPMAGWADSGGKVNFSFDTVTAVTVAILRETY